MDSIEEPKILIYLLIKPLRILPYWKKALSILPDNAAREVLDTDIAEYEVVRVADEVVVDLMGSLCGIDFKSAENQIEVHEIDGVRIPLRLLN